MAPPRTAATSSAALAKPIDIQAMRCASRASAPFVSCTNGPMILNGPSIRNSSVKIFAGARSWAMPAGAASGSADAAELRARPATTRTTAT